MVETLLFVYGNPGPEKMADAQWVLNIHTACLLSISSGWGKGGGNKTGSSFLPHSYYFHLLFPFFFDSLGEFLALKSLLATVCPPCELSTSNLI